MKEYYQQNLERFQKLDGFVIDAMGALLGESKLKLFKHDEGGLDMCKAFEEEREEGREEGICQSIRNLMKNLNMTAEQAMDAIGIGKEERQKYELYNIPN